MPAGELKAGQLLRTGGGTWAADRLGDPADSGPARVHNLSVADFRTYYVLAGDTPLLVHNASQCFLPKAALRAATSATRCWSTAWTTASTAGRTSRSSSGRSTGSSGARSSRTIPGGLHSEQLMAVAEEQRRSRPDAGQADLLRAGPVHQGRQTGRTCLGIAQSYPNAEVSYSLTGTKRENRKAIMDVMIRGAR